MAKKKTDEDLLKEHSGQEHLAGWLMCYLMMDVTHDGVTFSFNSLM